MMRTIIIDSLNTCDDYEYELSLLSAVVSMLFLVCLSCRAVKICVGAVFGGSSYSRINTKASTFLGLLVFGIEIPHIFRFCATDNHHALAHLIQGTDDRLQTILQLVPEIQRGPRPLFFWTNRHLQFIPWLIQNEIHQRPGIPYQRIHLPVTDCHDKFSCQGRCKSDLTVSPNCDSNHSQTMLDTITLDIFPPLSEDLGSFNANSPIILFSPGLTCHSQDLPGNMIVRRAYEMGFRSAIINRRGHTPQQKLQSPRWNVFGDIDDLEQAYWFLKRQVAPHTAFFLHGISSGTAVVVSALSKWDYRRQHFPQEATPAFVASVSVTPGYDTSKALTRERFRFPYHDFLLARVKDHFVRSNEDVLRRHDNETVNQVLRATSMQDFVDLSAPFAGYANASMYYQDTNPINNLRAITTPKLVLNSMDDPCCSIGNLFEPSPYPAHGGKAYADIISETQNTLVAVTWTGSHCPFLSWDDKLWLPLVRDYVGGGWMLNSWADRVSVEFYRAALEVYGDRRFP